MTSVTLSLDEIEDALDAITDARAAVDTLATHLHQRSVPPSIPSSIGTLRACLTLLRVQLQTTIETEAAAKETTESSATERRLPTLTELAARGFRVQRGSGEAISLVGAENFLSALRRTATKPRSGEDC